MVCPSPAGDDADEDGRQQAGSHGDGETGHVAADLLIPAVVVDEVAGQRAGGNLSEERQHEQQPHRRPGGLGGVVGGNRIEDGEDRVQGEPPEQQHRHDRDRAVHGEQSGDGDGVPDAEDHQHAPSSDVVGHGAPDQLPDPPALTST